MLRCTNAIRRQVLHRYDTTRACIPDMERTQSSKDLTRNQSAGSEDHETGNRGRCPWWPQYRSAIRITSRSLGGCAWATFVQLLPPSCASDGNGVACACA